MNQSHPAIGAMIATVVSRVRRNHALEHATMHVLNERGQRLRLVARSSPWGFDVYGDIPTDELLAAVQEALRRLRFGDRELAVHPNCGTNLALAGALGGMSAFVALWNPPREGRRRLTRLPVAILAATLGVAAAAALGPLVQARITTQADPGTMRVVAIECERKPNMLVHRVRTGDAG